jgi:flagellar biosynthesis/type III secretory pathway protein FliH
MMRSLPETVTPAAAGAQGPALGSAAIARFALWPLPELPGRGEQGLGASQGEPVGPTPVEEAWSRGHAAGRAEATEEANRTLKRAAGLLVSTAEALDAARLGVVRELEDAVYLLGLAIAKHLIQREVAADPAIVRELVHRGLDAFPVGSRVEIHLHPDDLTALRSQFELPGRDGHANDLQWLPDPAVERGGCTLETPHRVVDGRVDLALGDLYNRMRDD